METTASPTPADGSGVQRRRRRPTRIDVLGVVETGIRGWPLVLARLSDDMGSISLRARTYERVKELALRADLWIQRVNFVQHFRAGECSWALGWLISDLARWERDGKGGWRRVRPQPARVGAAR